MRRFTIAQKGLLILLLPLVYQAALLGVLLSQQTSNRTAQDLAVHTKIVLSELDRLMEDVLMVQNEARGYVFFREAMVGTDLEIAMKDLPLSVDRLSRLVSDNPTQTPRVQSIRDESAKLTQWAHEVQVEAAANRWDEAAAILRTRQGIKAVGAIRQSVSEMRDLEDRLDTGRVQNLKEVTSRQNSILIVGFAINLVVGVAAMGLFGQNIGRRFTVLEKNVERISEGEQLHETVGGTDELAELDRSFHRMADALVASREQERVAKTVLETRNQELQVANRELDHKHGENEMFVYSVSHDLRSPLVNLQGFSKELGMVRDDLRGLLSKPLDDAERARAVVMIDRDITESIHYIQTAVSRLATIIDALLKLSRAGRVEYRSESVEMDPIVQTILTAMRQTIDQRKVEFVSPHLPAAWGDRAAVEQIFANLIGNAVNYLNPARPGRIELGVTPKLPPGMENATVYFVRDNGLGIPAPYLPKLFAAFQRLHGNVAPGEGIGLALVRRTVERHGGRIWVESEDGVGSTFYVALPNQPENAAEFAPESKSDIVPTPNATK